RVLILLFARDAVLLCNVLASVTHVVVVIGVPQSVVHHGVDNLAVSEAITLASVRQKIRSVRHALHTSGDDDLRVARLDGLLSQSHRFQSRAAYFVDGCRRYSRGQSAAECRLTCRILTQAGL